MVGQFDTFPNMFATAPPVVAFFSPRLLIPLSVVPCMSLCESGCGNQSCQLVRGGLDKVCFWLAPNETKEENYIEKQNKGAGKGGALVIKGCAQDCATTTTTTSSVPMMKRIYSTAAIVPSPPCDRLHARAWNGRQSRRFYLAPLLLILITGDHLISFSIHCSLRR